MLPEWQINALYESLGRRIKSRREEKSYKQAQFASLLKISRASLVNIEQGRQRPPLHNLYEIARLLDLTIHDLLPELLKEPTTAQEKYEEVLDKQNIKGKDKLRDFIKHA